jgi:hypothetical protein
MERWGVPVPHSDDEEETELALSFDDAEFQHDPASIGSNGADGTGDRVAAGGASAGASAGASGGASSGATVGAGGASAGSEHLSA